MASISESVQELNWGKSLLTVESVQELAKKQQEETIPDRYIRTDIATPNPTAVSYDYHMSIPIIDMTKFSQELEREQEVNYIAQTCEEWGFFQVVNHGIPNSLMDGVKKVGKDFSRASIGGETEVCTEARRSLGLWPDIRCVLQTKAGDRHISTTLLKEVVDKYNTEIKELARKLLSLIAESLQLKPDFFENKFEKPYQNIWMNYCPQCPRPDLVLGLSPHADMTGIALLLQDDEVVGLHIRKDDQWIAVQPIPYALVINVGNLIEVMRNGRYKSVEHRAVTNSYRDRLSIGVFYAPGMEEMIGPARELIDPSHPRLFRNFIHKDYIQYYFSRGVEGKHSFYEYAGINL